MAKNILDFKSNLIKGGARPNLFKVIIDFPTTLQSEKKSDLDVKTAKQRAEFLVKSAQIPAFNIGVIEVPFKGRMLKIAGDRTFDPWTVNVINEGDFGLRQKFEMWSRDINALTENVSALGYTSGQNTTSSIAYCKDMYVYQYGRDNIKPERNPSNDFNTNTTTKDTEEFIRGYKFFDAWPSSISSIDLNYESNNQIEEFTVEFQYQYFEVINSAIDSGLTQ